MNESEENMESDDESLNEESEDDNELKKELEADFEKNSDEIMKIVDRYTHTIDDIESGRKKLAKKIVAETREGRKSGMLMQTEQETKKKTKIKSPVIKAQRPINKNLMFATFRKKKKSNQFDSARSRRGSSFVDDYNV